MTTKNSKTRVKIGITFAAREVELEVDDPEVFAREFDDAVSDGRKVWWVTDSMEHRHGLIVEKISYVDVEPARDRQHVGFGAVGD